MVRLGLSFPLKSEFSLRLCLRVECGQPNVPVSIEKRVPLYITNTASLGMSAHKRRHAIETFSADPCGMKRTSAYS